MKTFLISALDGSQWSVSRPCRFTPEERTPGTHSIGGCVDPRFCLDVVEKRKKHSHNCDSQLKVKVTLRLTVSQSVSQSVSRLNVEPHLGLMTRYLLLFDSYGLVFVGHEMSSPTPTLGSWVRIPFKAWMFVCVYSVLVLSCVGSNLATG
jgi:hypothetical protein